mmetsp:Transcript_9140/g.14899  ORF Transcript_9140/g.14899 Transcript_9140/m.14899 type:complete len:171 (+) Transcript_9140:76-588(+)
MHALRPLSLASYFLAVSSDRAFSRNVALHTGDRSQLLSLNASVAIVQATTSQKSSLHSDVNLTGEADITFTTSSNALRLQQQVAHHTFVAPSSERASSTLDDLQASRRKAEYELSSNASNGILVAVQTVLIMAGMKDYPRQHALAVLAVTAIPLLYVCCISFLRSRASTA